jgi:hypothetical protein
VIIPLTPVKKKPRYRARVVVYWSMDWHQLVAAGWTTQRMMPWHPDQGTDDQGTLPTNVTMVLRK